MHCKQIQTKEKNVDSRWPAFVIPPLSKVWRYKRGNQKPLIGERQTMQWLKEKGQTTIYKTLHRKVKIEQYEPH
jgi:hypothetical protein